MQKTPVSFESGSDVIRCVPPLWDCWFQGCRARRRRLCLKRSSLVALLPPDLLQRIISSRARPSDGSEDLVLEAADHVSAVSSGAQRVAMRAVGRLPHAGQPAVSGWRLTPVPPPRCSAGALPGSVQAMAGGAGPQEGLPAGARRSASMDASSPPGHVRRQLEWVCSRGPGVRSLLLCEDCPICRGALGPPTRSAANKWEGNWGRWWCPQTLSLLCQPLEGLRLHGEVSRAHAFGATPVHGPGLPSLTCRRCRCHAHQLCLRMVPPLLLQTALPWLQVLTELSTTLDINYALELWPLARALRGLTRLQPGLLRHMHGGPDALRLARQLPSAGERFAGW